MGIVTFGRGEINRVNTPQNSSPNQRPTAQLAQQIGIK